MAGRGALTKQVESLLDAAMRNHRADRLHDAVEGYRKVLTLAPRNIDAHMNLGAAYAQMGRQREAIEHFRKAIAVVPDIAAVHRDFGAALLEFGRWDEAEKALRRAAELDPHDAAAFANLGFLCAENGRREEAVKALERAVLIDPGFANAYYTMHIALYDDRDPRPSLAALSQAVTFDPESPLFRFAFAVLLDQVGDANGAKQQYEWLATNEAYRGGVTSWAYVKAHRAPGTRLFSTTRATLLHGLAEAKLDGLVTEFGVRYGTSLRWLAAHAGTTVHGFDSFSGLPEDWHVRPKGTYSTHGELPEVPANVSLHPGLFDATIPAFAAEHAGPVRYANVDCDLYSSTACIFQSLGDRIVPGTVLVFDEYLLNDRWMDDEHKAFQEAVWERGWKYEYLAFSPLTAQAVVRIL